MDEPILKIHWERFRAHVDLNVELAAQLLLNYTKSPIDQLTLLSEGCANTNYKITFNDSSRPVVLRIYVRDASALQRELDIHKLITDKIPVPAYLFTDEKRDIFSYPYAIMEWIDGKLMREIILSKNETAISECAYEAGKYLNELRKIKFSRGGFFEKDLHIRPFNQEEEYFPFVMQLLQSNIVKESLGADLHKYVQTLINDNADLLPQKDEANLTHADYDPANMLVKQIDGKYKISSILDWEFSFAGTYLLDIGMMLRYAHKLPSCYEKNFINSIETFGSPLPLYWKKQAKLMDLLCLLNLIYYNPFAERPKMNRDVVSLVSDTVKQWESGII